MVPKYIEHIVLAAAEGTNRWIYDSPFVFGDEGARRNFLKFQRTRDKSAEVLTRT